MEYRQLRRFAAAHSDGQSLDCCRWSSDDHPPTLCLRQEADRVIVVCEPVDRDRPGWRPIPPNHAPVARVGGAARMVPFDVPAMADAQA